VLKSTVEALKKRGYPDKALENIFQLKKTDELILLLKKVNAQERTAAACILGVRNEKKAVKALCNALAGEKALYSKIAISDALGNIGVYALPGLIELLGMIGKNQHIIPSAGNFKKKSYPLPRDIAARTITKIGAPALAALESVAVNGTITRVSEAVDAIGFIAFYTNDRRSLKCLIQCMEKNAENELVTWKVIRALESFPCPEVEDILKKIIKSSKNKLLIQEAKRSLKQLTKL